jgi:hypothetical protein
MDNTVKQFLETVERGQLNAVSVAERVLEDGTKSVRLELEQKRAMPERMESPARGHKFHDVAGFVQYIKANAGGKLLVLIDAKNRMVKAVLDESAKQGYEVILFNPPYHPRFELLRETLLGTHEVAEFAMGVMRNREVIIGVDGQAGAANGRSLALLMKQITIASEVTAEEGVGNNAVNGVMVKTSVKAGDAKSKVDLPESIQVQVPIYLNTPQVRIDIQVTVKPLRAERVAIICDAPELPVIEHDLFDEILHEVRSLEGALVSYGSVQFTDWTYNK